MSNSPITLSIISGGGADWLALPSSACCTAPTCVGVFGLRKEQPHRASYVIDRLRSCFSRVSNKLN